MSVNDITGDTIRTDVPSEKFKSGFETIWGSKQKCKQCNGTGCIWSTIGEPPSQCDACGDQEP